MARERQYKFDLGDWVAVPGRYGHGYRLVGRVVDADSESVTCERRDGTRAHFVVEEDPIVHAYWRGRTWFVR